MDYFPSKILKNFVLSQQLRGKSDATIKTYLYRINRFFRSVNIPARQVSERDIKDYIQLLFEKSYAVNTINGAIIALKIFYGDLRKKGLIFQDPASGICLIEKEPAFPKSVLSTAAMESIRSALKGEKQLNLRDRAIIEIFYSTGLRLSELAHLKIADLDLGAGVLTVRKGKGGRDRRAILNKDAVSAITKYLETRRKAPDQSKFLWINRYGKPISSRGIQKLLKKAAGKAGLHTTANPHAWRHGVATALLRSGASIRAVQVFLGHSRIKTTQRYTHLTSLDLQKAHRNTHPREMDPIPENIEPIFSLPVPPKSCWQDEGGSCCP